jgi:anti-anti-sigma factor
LDDEFRLETYLIEAGTLGVRVVGELDMATAVELTDAVGAWPQPVNRCVVDLSQCSFIDSSGIRALLLCQRELDGGSGVVQLTGVSAHVDRVLRIAGVHQVLRVADRDGGDGDGRHADADELAQSGSADSGPTE